MSKKYNYKDNFEMLYLRHEYITKDKKMEGKYVKEYAPIVHTTAKIMYDKLYPNFNKVGFDLEDIIGITNIYMLGYMGQYSLKNNPKEYDRYVQKYKERYGFDTEPTEKEIEKSERNHLINFLRQRLQHCSTICARKARNITVGKDRRGIFAETPNSTETCQENILNEWNDYGYRKVTKKEFKQAKKEARKVGSKELFDNKGYRMFEIEILNGGISHEDYSLIFKSTQHNKFLMTPETRLIHKEENKIFENNMERFNKLSNLAKRRKLIQFIRKNKDNKLLKKELTLARKMIKSLKIYGIINRDE